MSGCAVPFRVLLRAESGMLVAHSWPGAKSPSQDGKQNSLVACEKSMDIL
jgi:hypothetical protein